MTREKCYLALDHLKPFLNLSPQAIKGLQQIAILYQLEAGEMLFRQGELTDSFYVVQSGGVRLVEYTADGKAVSLKVYGVGDLFGMLSISGALQNRAGIQAIDSCQIVAIHAQACRQLMLACPDLALRILDLIVEHVHYSHARIAQLAAERVERRIARALIHFYRKFGKLQDGGYVIDIILSQRDIAEFTGTTFETVNRTLREWEKAGLIACTRKRIIILALVELESLVGETDIYDMVAE